MTHSIKLAKPAILVVADNTEMNRFIAESLSGEYNVVVAFDGQQGLEMALAENPALIVTAIMMPRMSGVEMIAKIRKRPELADVPILLLSAKADEELKVKLLEQGAQDFIAHPFSEQDILARIKNLLALKQAQERYQNFIKSMDQGFCIIEVIFDENKNPIDYVFLEINNAFIKQTGIQNARGKRMRELAPSLEQYWFDLYGKIALTGESVRLENHTEALGRWFEIYAFRVGAAENRQVAVFFSDITARKKTEEALRQSEQRFHAIFKQAAVGMAIATLDGRFEQVNERCAEILGYATEDIYHHTFRELTYPDDILPTEALVRRLLANEIKQYALEKRYRRKDGSLVWSLTTVTLLRDAQNRPHRFIGVIEDISKRKQTEEGLRQSEAELRALANSIPQMAWITEANGNIFWYNQRWYDYTGTTLEQMSGWGWEKVHHPDHLARVIHIWKEALSTGNPWEDTFPLRGANGEYRWFLSRAFPLRDAEGKITRWFGTNTDIEEATEVQEALREETRILELLNKTGTSIASQLDLKKVVQTVTDAGKELSGAKFGAFFYNVTNEQGESLMLFTLSGALRSAFENFGLPRNTPIFNPTFKGEGIVRSADITQDPRYGKVAPHFGMPKGHPPVRSYLAASVISRSGEPIGGLFFGHPEANIFTERSERLILGIAAQAAIAIDNAHLYEDRKKAEIALKQAHDELELRVVERTAKLSEAVAQMEEFSYTISHDLRAPLRAMQAYSNILVEDLGEILAAKPEAIEYLTRISHNAGRLDKMVLDLLTFSRLARGELHLEFSAILSSDVPCAR
jgi:PAS domain S-box-containing protein